MQFAIATIRSSSAAITVDDILFKEHSPSRGQINRNDSVIVVMSNAHHQSQAMHGDDLVRIVFHDKVVFVYLKVKRLIDDDAIVVREWDAIDAVEIVNNMQHSRRLSCEFIEEQYAI